MNAIYAIASTEAWKIQDFDGIWIRDLAIPVDPLTNFSFVGFNEPVRNECEPGDLVTSWKGLGQKF